MNRIRKELPVEKQAVCICVRLGCEAVDNLPMILTLFVCSGCKRMFVGFPYLKWYRDQVGEFVLVWCAGCAPEELFDEEGCS